MLFAFIGFMIYVRLLDSQRIRLILFFVLFFFRLVMSALNSTAAVSKKRGSLIKLDTIGEMMFSIK